MRKLVLTLLLCAASLAPAITAGDPPSRSVVAYSVRTQASTETKPFARLFSLEQGAGRWDPCTTVSWKMNVNGYTEKRFKQAVVAFRMLRRATGLTIRYAGTTTPEEIALLEENVITVSFVSPDEMSPFVIGTAGVALREFEHGGGIARSDVRIALHTGFDRRHGYVPVLLHELGHAVGLGHSSDRRSMMFPTQTSAVRYNASDLAGFKTVGAANGCITPPAVDPAAAGIPAG